MTLWETLFQGVQALRLAAVDISSVYGRDGVPAHTYLLGQRGDSNGCISLQSYASFLQAFQQGEIKRRVVVTRS